METLDLVLECADLAHQVGSLIGGDRRGNDGTGDTAGTAECHLGGDVNVRNVLVLAEKGKVEKDGEWAGVGSEDDDLGDTAVQRLSSLVGTFL